MEQRELQALCATQHRLWRLITEPSGVEAALTTEGDPGGAGLVELIRGDRGLTPADRLAVYANAYFVRLHDCLREDFGALARALGAAAFHDLVTTYLMMHPPTCPSLRHAGAHLAEHLTTEPFRAIFSRRCAYVADLARLEWAMTESFSAEDAPVLPREDLAAVAPEAWRSLRFETMPSLQRLAFAWPVHGVRERFDREDPETAWHEPPSLVAAPTHVRVWRLGERVRYRAIRQLESEALGAAMAGEPFGAICERMVEVVGEAEAALQAASMLSTWVSDGLFVRRL